MENLVEFTDDNFEAEVLQSDVPVIVDFWAEWCGPCKALMPTVGEIADEYSGKAVIGKVNVDNCPGIASKYGIRSIPSILFFSEGSVQDQLLGAVPKAQITSVIDKLVK